MSDRYEQTIGNAAAKAAPALAGAGGSAMFLGLGADQWALIGFVLTATYAAIQIVLCLPNLMAMAKHYWRRWFGRGPDDSDAAGDGDAPTYPHDDGATSGWPRQ